jgi:hypothetical protein
VIIAVVGLIGFGIFLLYLLFIKKRRRETGIYTFIGPSLPTTEDKESKSKKSKK